jgi:trk system potassium uptake protein TrkH
MKKYFLPAFFVWLGICFLGALPYYFSGNITNLTDAVFESVSGFTTTGVTLLADIEALPRWLLFFRALSNWLGGMGIVLFTAALLPFMGAGGFQLQKADAFGAEDEKISPHFGLFARILLLLYISLTALLVLLLFFFGMDWFDAAAHAFSVMSTGGFSTRSAGIAYYNSPGLEWVCVVFMFLAGFNFFLFWQLLRGKAGVVMRSSEARAYTGIILAAAIIIAIAILPQSPSFGTALRQALFHVTSLLSTCGFHSADFSQWPPAAQGVLFFLLFIGGCSGSAAGGIKVIRYVVLSKQTWNEMKRILYPRGVFNIRLDGRSGKKDMVYGVAGFVFLYFLVLFFTALLVSSCGADVFTAINTALICQGNIGLGLKNPGAANIFPGFPAYVKWGLSLIMIAGRLELWTVLALFTGDFWRK